MRSSSRLLDTFLYRAALSLCPAGFRRAYADEMVRDFAEARDDASVRPAGGLWQLRLVMAVDIGRTIVVQWSRTGLPVIAAISLTCALALAEGLATLARRGTLEMPIDTEDAEIIGVLLLATTALVVVAMTIVLTLWVSRPIRRGRRGG